MLHRTTRQAVHRSWARRLTALATAVLLSVGAAAFAAPAHADPVGWQGVSPDPSNDITWADDFLEGPMTVDVPYEGVLTPVAGDFATIPYVSSGELPPWLYVVSDGPNIVIKGTPVGTGTWTFTINGSTWSTDPGNWDYYLTSRTFTVTVTNDSGPGCVGPFQPVSDVEPAVRGDYYLQYVGDPGEVDMTLCSDLPNWLQFIGGQFYAFQVPVDATSVTMNVQFGPSALHDYRSYYIEVTGAAPWDDDDLPGGNVGEAYRSTVKGPNHGDHDYSYAVTSGSVPGLTLASDGTLSGTPTQVGSFDLGISATDGDTHFSTTVTVVIRASDWEDVSLADGTVGVVYHDAVVGPDGDSHDYAYSVTSGSLPDGLSLASDGTVAGTPEESGRFSVGVKAVDGPVARTATVELTIAAAPPWVDSRLGRATVGKAYSDAVVGPAVGAPYTYAVAGGSAPSWLRLSDDGVVSGTPTAPGSFTFDIAATSATANYRTTVTLEVVAAPVQHPTAELSLGFGAGTSVADASVEASAGGLLPGSEYTLTLHSAPVVLLSGIVGPSGALSAHVALPADTPDGAHHLVLAAVAADGSDITAEAWFSVLDGVVKAVSTTGPVADPRPEATDPGGQLPQTGSDVLLPLGIALAALVAGGALLLASRRRRALS